MRIKPGDVVQGESEKGFYREVYANGEPFIDGDGEENWIVINEQAPPLNGSNDGGQWQLMCSIEEYRETNDRAGT